MTAKNIGQQVLDKIEQEHIEPKAEWTFKVKDSVVWTFGAVSLVIGAVSFAVVLHLITSNDWDVYEYIHDDFMTFALVTLPYFWLVVFGSFLILARYYTLHTKKGYRIGMIKIAVGSLVVCVIVGTVLHAVGAGEYVDDTLTENVGPYEHVVQNKKAIWTDPEEGRVAGQVITFTSPKNFELKDLSGRVWRINAEEAKIPVRIHIVTSSRVRLLGEPEGDKAFEAHTILPIKPQDRKRVRSFLEEHPELIQRMHERKKQHMRMKQ